MLFEPFSIKNVTFKNRILRSSIGGKTCYYDGTVNPAWKRFEKRFAEQGVAGIISATISVDERRWSPLEYPKLSQDRFVKPIREVVQAVQARGCCPHMFVRRYSAHWQGGRDLVAMYVRLLV